MLSGPVLKQFRTYLKNSLLIGGVWKEERKALLKKLAKKRVDQLNSEKQEPANRSSSFQIDGKRGGSFVIGLLKMENFIDNIINLPLF